MCASSPRQSHSNVAEELEIIAPDVEHAGFYAGGEIRESKPESEGRRLGQRFLDRCQDAMSTERPVIRVRHIHLRRQAAGLGNPHRRPHRGPEWYVSAVATCVGHDFEARDDVVRTAEGAEALIFGGGSGMDVGVLLSRDVDGAATAEALREKPPVCPCRL